MVRQITKTEAYSSRYYLYTEYATTKENAIKKAKILEKQGFYTAIARNGDRYEIFRKQSKKTKKSGQTFPHPKINRDLRKVRR